MLSWWYKQTRPLHKQLMALSTASAHQSGYNTLQDYHPPSWAQQIKPQPSKYVQLATRPTPIHQWRLPGLPEGIQVSVKRDDMTGSVLGGNKIRKLEFLLADALQQGCDHVITSGGIQSNHARTTAVASRQLGLQPHLVLRWKGKIDPSAVGCNGNVFLDRCVGAKILLVPPLKYETSISGDKSLKQVTGEYAEKLKSQGGNPYIVPLGGSNEIGAWGYIQAFQELLEQGVTESFDDVVMACGSGGTVLGLALGNYLTGSKLKIHAVCVCDDANYFHGHIDDCLRAMRVTDSKGEPLQSRNIVDIIEGHKGEGYAVSTKEELDQLTEIVSTTGVPLDPVYTLKGVRGMLSELTTNPERFAGKRVLYVHTGGVFGLYDGRMEEVLLNTQTTNQVFDYSNLC